MRVIRKISGDTLVEVMIAMAVIGTVIALCYSTASRSLLIGRRAQEKTEALKVAESQIEILKALGPSTQVDIFNEAGDSNYLTEPSFCVSPTTPYIYKQNTIPNDIFAPGINLSSSAPGVTPTGSTTYNGSCREGVANRYHKSITRSASGDTFTVRVRWERLGGGLEEVSLIYRLHKEQFGR